MTTEGSEQILRVGVVGCGEIAQVMHLPYLRDLPGFADRARLPMDAGPF